MAKNDPLQDRYNPPGSTEHEWERKVFNELNLDENFHQSNKPDGYAIQWRKVNETQAMNLKSREIHNWKDNAVVFVRI